MARDIGGRLIAVWLLAILVGLLVALACGFWKDSIANEVVRTPGLQQMDVPWPAANAGAAGFIAAAVVGILGSLIVVAVPEPPRA